MRAVLVAAAVSLLFSALASCAGSPEAVPAAHPEPQTTRASRPEPPVYTVYLPLESLTAVQLEDGKIGESLVVLRFDRPGAWSVYPHRFLFHSGGTRRLSPVQTYGSSRIKQMDLLILRNAAGRRGAYKKGRYGTEFFSQEFETLPLPEGIVFVSDKYIDRTILLDPETKEPGGLASVEKLPVEQKKQLLGLSGAGIALVDEVLRAASAAGGRRGYGSVAFLPFSPQQVPPYPAGLDLEIGLPSNISVSDPITEVLDISLVPRRSAENPFPKLTLGDLGIFAGATPLLDTRVREVSRTLHQSDVLTKIGSSGSIKASPVLWEGSFNAYRDERRKFLFYPGVFSYIPGKHPDISPADATKVTGMGQAEFDALLKGRNLITFQRRIYGGIPGFIAASNSPTRLEIAFQNNQQLRTELRQFLAEPAYVLWLD